MSKGEEQVKNDMELKRKIKLSDESPFMVKEAYKLVTANILFSLTQDRGKCIAITSASISEGRTTTAMNMAIYFSQIGKRTLLIDANIRDPQIHSIFALNNDIGLSNVLGGFVKSEDAIKSIGDGLHIMTSGNMPANSTELLSNRCMRNLINELEGVYDYIFIDTPPINVLADAIIISECVSGVVMVTKQNQTKHPELQEALKKLNFVNAKMLGIILTGVKQKSKQHIKNTIFNRNIQPIKWTQYSGEQI